MSVIVSKGEGSLDMIPGISLDTSTGDEKPRCFLHGSFLRVLPAIHRRTISFAHMPTASGGDGVHSGSDRNSVCWLPLRTCGILCLGASVDNCSECSFFNSSTNDCPVCSCV